MNKKIIPPAHVGNDDDDDEDSDGGDDAAKAFVEKIKC